ncbi:MAG: hypothetical protein IH940_00375 [Acidobacteria bacterium]|nr:hypothetical protein [Acidobacteriota bacterium]
MRALVYRIIAALSLLMVTVFTSPTSARAQDSLDPVASQIDPTLELVGSSTWISPDDDIRLQLTHTTIDTAVLRARLHGSVLDRSGFNAALADEFGDVREHFGPVEINTDGPTRFRMNPQAKLPEGVYPVVVELVAGSRVLAELTTFVVSTDRDESMHGLLAMLSDPDVPIAHQPDGSVVIPEVNELIELGEDAAALSFNITGDTTSALATTRDVDNIASSVGEVLTSTFVEVETEAWLDAGADAQLAVQLAEGRRAITEATGVPPAPIWVGHPSDTARSIRWLSDRDIDGFVLRESNLEPLATIDGETTMTGPFLIETPGTDAVGIAIDEQLASRLDESDPFLAAQILVADMAVMMLDSGSDEFGFIIEAPTTNLVPAVLDAVDSSPFLDVSSVGSLVHEVPLMQTSIDSALPLARRLDPRPASPIGSLPTTILFAQDAISSFGEILGERTGLVLELETKVAVGSAAELSEIESDAYFNAVYAGIESATTGIEGPMNQTITLTARTQTVPYTIENDLGYQANVLLVFESDALEFPDGAAVEQTLARGSNELHVRVHARSAGDAVLQITVRSPDGTHQLAASRVRVRSSVFSGLGVIISVVALAVLLLWWAREILRSRKRKVRAPAQKTGDTDDNDEASDADGPEMTTPEETADAE